ncbi:MAG: SMP-30/gluconolactonase/LRE family protein, partial [Chloroflexota bacterium]|nr:SMP-30/gluconolactonase/LRE family protein [Chloroflexota bacterium]
MAGSATPLLDARFKMGECPVWDEIEQALYFVDIGAHALHRYDWRSKDLTSWTLPEECGSFGLRRAGGAVVALRSSVVLFDFASGKVTRTLCSF